MEYEITIEINQSLKAVTDAFIDKNQMPLWEKGLTQIESTKDVLFDQGSEGFLIFEAGDHHQKMKVSVVLNDLPQHMDLLYEVPGVWNLCKNTFIEKDHQTIWTMSVVFKFDEEQNYPKDLFMEQTKKGMMQFKSYLEKDKHETI